MDRSAAGRLRAWVWLALWTMLVGAVLFVGASPVIGAAPAGGDQRIEYVENGMRLASDVRDHSNGLAPLRTAGAPQVSVTLDVPDRALPAAAADIAVYDYTRVGTEWTPLIQATVDEFNAVRPPTAPRLVYVWGPGDKECLDLAADVWDLTGIIVCDTSRPDDFPHPNIPADRWWAGSAGSRDADTVAIALNSWVPDGYSRPYEQDDITVCHELMHAYTGVGDNDDSDVSGS
jgi:hypothetical protein